MEQNTQRALELLTEDEAVAEAVLSRWNDKYSAEVNYYPDLYQAKRYSAELSRIEYKRAHWYQLLIKIRGQIRELQARLTEE